MAVLKGSNGSSSPVKPDPKYGVWGESDTGNGLAGTSAQSYGVKGETASTHYATAGVYGKDGASYDPGTGKTLVPDQKCGVWGESDNGYGVAGTSAQSSGLQGGSINGDGIVGTSVIGTGVRGIGGERGNGVYGLGNIGVVADGAIHRLTATTGFSEGSALIARDSRRKSGINAGFNGVGIAAFSDGGCGHSLHIPLFCYADF
jgi:hypothetical protein